MKKEYSIPLSRILHEKYGFLVYPSNPSEKEQKEYEKVCSFLHRNDLPYTPYVPVLFERQLSKVTSLIIEGNVLRTKLGTPIGYRYDFYKARYINSSEPRDIKVYGEQLVRQELLSILRHFKFLEQG
ncbi:hypothetical protein [Enterococcus faecalis]|uniref:hypothetical protein n=1 Tax=Enterococcus TaxID=1350 RepID=UPI001884647A|nr:hypothetical protein [Enterococcus faecalis]MBF0006437.1 hypothetical protein [Enterococcus faecalis]MBF0009120.1 hypothetical protein [Enterococcus faecalis]MBF0018401.1 hypothetical protein [Enterococcus faecalis]